MTEETKKLCWKESIRNYWRPAFAFVYMIIVVFDMIVFPIVWSAVQVMKGLPLEQWKPLTLDSSGIFHLAMGSVCGVSAWTRGKEKLSEKSE